MIGLNDMMGRQIDFTCFIYKNIIYLCMFLCVSFFKLGKFAPFICKCEHFLEISFCVL